MILTVLITSTKHFVVSISYHPKTLQLKRLTWSMPMFSGIWTLLYQEEITFPQGQYFFLLLIRTRGSAAGCARRPKPCLLAKTVGSGIFQFSYYPIAISANAGCMDLGFIVGGQRTLVKQGNSGLSFSWRLVAR